MARSCVRWGWPGTARSPPSSVRRPYLVLLAGGTIDRFERIVLAARRRDLIPPGRLDLDGDSRLSDLA